MSPTVVVHACSGFHSLCFCLNVSVFVSYFIKWNILADLSRENTGNVYQEFGLVIKNINYLSHQNSSSPLRENNVCIKLMYRAHLCCQCGIISVNQEVSYKNNPGVAGGCSPWTCCMQFECFCSVPRELRVCGWDVCGERGPSMSPSCIVLFTGSGWHFSSPCWSTDNKHCLLTFSRKSFITWTK